MAQSQIFLIIAVNILAWLIFHIGLAWLGTRIPGKYFNPNFYWFRTFCFEKNGKIYERLFFIKIWKDKIPDGAAWFKGGFRKKKLVKANNEYLLLFIVETCRGETVHWLVFFSSGFFFIWNDIGVGLIMVLYAFLANFPCIIIQRYNRIRLRRIAIKRDTGT